ncbi:MAG: transcription antitermination factor NusB [Candidatus Aminicenantes bacterium]|nr:transcription antitermination factor NusB [Candidatus Aminicenantes bacterium]
MGVRRKSREAALQLLYQSEFDDSSPKTRLNRFWASRKEDRSVREYADRLVLGILEHRQDLDGLIQSVSKNWRISRMSIIDRNILRMATYELRHEVGLAPAVVINEAIEIAKRYGGQEAAVFINGVLDGIRKSIKGFEPVVEDDHGPKKGQGTEKGTDTPTAVRGVRRKRPD